MAEQHARPVGIKIEGHTLSVGNRIYNIGNLVGTVVDPYPIGFVGGPVEAVRRKRWSFLFIFVAFLLHPSVWVQLALLAFLVATIVQIVRMLQSRDTGYVLKLETVGAVRGVITSRDPDEMHALARRVAQAINNPPSAPSEFVVYGDLVQQTGNNNVATQVR